MQFQIPQFIEREAKVVGPLTFKQFVYLGVPGAFAFFLYFTMPFFIFLVGTIALGFMGFALGFVKIGGRSLPTLIMNALSFSVGPKTYIWQKQSRRGGAAGPKEYRQTEEEAALVKQIKLTKR
ncbi:MAG: PrgI family protein [Candidatus Wildermuthbacteria bacterium]|nr:PrgI family protein [Candidatus Wildermuthbacteria bacterium]